jgi:WD40 repeat protein/serine/threonine protein kinase
MSESLSKYEPVEQLAEEFLARYRSGERPSLSEYTRKYPDLAPLIREYFPAMVVMEELGSVGSQASDTLPRTVMEGGKIPQQLGEYRILREVGRGGMGIVYEAVQESLGRHVALKVLPFHGLLTPTLLERFRREARAVARLHHTNIVPVFGVGEHAGLHYYAMQFIQGQGLHEVLHEVKRLRARVQEPLDAKRVLAASVAESLITGRFSSGASSGTSADGENVARRESEFSDTSQKRGADSARFCEASLNASGRATPPLSTSHSELTSQPEAQYFRSVAQIGVQVADALEYAHGQGVLHRDIKPSNLLLDTTGRVWVTDFGLAKADETDELTDPGDIVGTLCYMAPERLQGKADARSDIYGLGITLYEFLALQPAFADCQRARLIERVTHEEPRAPRNLDPRIPRDLETIILKAIAKAPGDRYPTAAALAADLHQFLADRPIRARRASFLERALRWCRRNPALAAAASLATLALAAVAGLAMALAIQQYQAAARLRGEQEQTGKYLVQAESERDRAERLSTTLALDRALSLCEQGDVALGVLWLARALEIAPEKEPEFRHLIRANLAAWEHELLPLRGLLQHQDVVFAVDWSSDSKAILTGGWEARGRLWNVDSGNELGSSLRHPSGVYTAVLSPDGRKALTVGGHAQVWDTATWPWRPLGRAIEREGFFGAAVFSPDGSAVVTGGSDGKVCRWDAASGEFLGELVSHGSVVRALAFSPKGRQLVTGGDDHMARLWNVTTGEPLGDPLAHQGTVHAVAFSHDGSRVVTASEDGTARLWDKATGEPLGLQLVHGGPVHAVAFSTDDQTVVTGGLDGTARLWDVATGKPLGLPLRHRGPIYAALFSPDGKVVATGGAENVVRLWDVSQVRRPRPTFQHDRWVRSAAFSPCGRYLLTGSDDGKARLWDLETNKLVGEPLRHGERVRSVAFSPNGRMFLTGSFDGVAQRWEVPTLKPIGRPIKHGSAIWAVAFSPDGKSFLTGDDEGIVQRWDNATAKPLGSPLRHPDRVDGLAWSPDGKTIATACLDKAARLWDADTGQALRIELRHQAPVWVVAFSPDGRTLLTAGWDGTARLWDAATGQPKGRPFAHQAKIEAAAFSPDGRTILTGGFDHAGRLWDVATGKPIGPPLVHGDLVLAVAFHPSGKLVALAGAPGAAKLWKVPPSAEDPVQDLVIRSQLLTGMTLDSEGAATVLPAETWYRLRGRWQLPLFSLQIAFCPFHPEPYYQRALIHTAAGRLDEAGADLQSATQLHANCVHAWIDLGHAFGRSRQWDRAAASYSKAIDQDPSNATARNSRAYAYSLLGQWNKAAEDLGPGGIESQPLDAGDYGCAWFDVACLRLLQGDKPGYQRLWAQLRERISGTEESFTGFYASYASRTVLLTSDSGISPRESLRWAEAAVSSNHRRADYLHILALAHYRAGQFDLAIQSAEESLKAVPRWGGTLLNWLLLAMAHERLGHQDEVRRWTKKVAQWRERVAVGRIANPSYEGQQEEAPCPPEMPLPDWLEYQVLSRESAGLLK